MAQTLSIRKYSRETKKTNQHSEKFLFWDLKLQDELLYKIYFLRVQYPNGKIEDIESYNQKLWIGKNSLR